MYTNKLKLIRENKNLKEKDVAKIINISNTLYCDYKNEKQVMPIKHLNKICNFFNIFFDYLFNFTEI